VYLIDTLPATPPSRRTTVRGSFGLSRGAIVVVSVRERAWKVNTVASV